MQLLKNETPEHFHEAIKQTWTDLHHPELPTRLEHFKANTQIIDRIAQDDNVLYLIFDSINFDFLYVGKNVKAFTGYTEEEMRGSRLKFLFKILRFDHLWFFAKVTEMSRIQKRTFSESIIAEFYTFSAMGLSFRHKNGNLVKTMYRAYGLESTPENAVAIQLFEVRNVSHLLKTDGFWFRGLSGVVKQYIYTFISYDRSRPWNLDIISDRELEVLKLIAEGMHSDEIAERLFISVNTVEKHRKNMIARMGARDTVALTEICRRVGIL